jgi:hypothetical protein
MSNGIIAAMLLLTRGEDSGVAGDQTVFLDFINEVYEVNGSPALVGDVIDTPSLVGASGLEIPLFDTPTEILGDARDNLLTAHWTMVLEVEIVTLVGAVWLFSMAELNSDGTIEGDTDTMQIGVDTGDLLFAYDDTGPGSARTINYGNTTVAVHKIAISRSDTRMAMSVDGQSVQDNNNDIALTLLSNATFGNFTGDFNARNAFIRSLVLYDEVQEDAVLQTLSGS